MYTFQVNYCLTTPGAIFCQRTLWCGRDRLLRPSGRTWSLQPQSLLVLPHQVFAKFRGRIALREWIHRCLRYFPSQQCDICSMDESRWLSWFVTENKRYGAKKFSFLVFQWGLPKVLCPNSWWRSIVFNARNNLSHLHQSSRLAPDYTFHSSFLESLFPRLLLTNTPF